MTEASVVGLVVAFGPEVRSLIYSGVASRLSSKSDVVVFTARPESSAFLGRPELIVEPLPEGLESAAVRKVRSAAFQARLSWLTRTTGAEKWRHYLKEAKLDFRPPSRSARFRNLVSGGLAVEGTGLAERAIGRGFGGTREWRETLTSKNIRLLVVSSFGSQRTLPAMQAACQISIPVAGIVNSWKDVHSHPHLHVWMDRLLVWDAYQSDAVQRTNPRFPVDRIRAVGSLHLQRFLETAPPVPWSDFCRVSGLDPNRRYICYTAASPRAVQHEDHLVETTLRALAKIPIGRKPQLLLRLNPMEDGSRFNELETEWAGEMVIQKPDWEWDPKADWCCPLPRDGALWHSTVLHSIGNVSVSSTVTLEFAAAGKPVVNLCFDSRDDTSPKESTRRFWDADFYSIVRDQQLVIAVFDNRDLESSLAKVVKECGSVEQRKPCTLANSVERVVTELAAL